MPGVRLKADQRRESVLPIILLTAVAYFAVGRLSLLLAIPPGYATAVWPAAGVALTVVLLWGYRVSVGVALGSFLVNFSLQANTDNLIGLAESLAIPAIIGMGAALQAVAGAWLIRRFISPDPKLDTARVIATFIFLGAAVSSMVNATIGSGALIFAGIVSPDNGLFTWVTWWCGDAIGILIFFVLLMTFFSQEREIWRPRRFIIVIPLTLCFIGIVTLFVFSSRWEVSQQRLLFERKAENLYSELAQAMAAPKELLNAISGFYAASDNVSRDEFATFVERPLNTQPGIQALSWVPVVTRKERGYYEQLAQQELSRPFVFTERQGDGLGPASERPVYYPVYYLEPYRGNEKALGFDLGSNPSRLAAIQLAVRSRAVTSTESIRLVQETGEQKAIIMFLPLYTKENPEEILGLVDVVFRIGDLVQKAIPQDDAEGVVLTLTEVNDRGETSQLLSTTEFWPDSVAGKQVGAFQWQKHLDIGNRDWLISVVANQDFLAASRTLVPWSILAAGLFFSGLLGAFLLFITGETYRAKNAAEELRDTLNHLRNTQSQLLESEKLASVGGMMSGLAHELNTPVGIAVTAVSSMVNVIGSLEEKLAAKTLGQQELTSSLTHLEEGANIALGNLNRTAQLVKSFKDVAVDRATGDVRRINIREYLGEILEYMKPSYKRSSHDIQLRCDDALTMTTVPGSLSQVVINLLSNSLMHAFDEGVPGHILIEVERRAEGIYLVYEDDGRGIAEEEREKVFESFFTTRKGTGGTGLGLHLVSNIVSQQLGGSIRLTASEAGGARFEITLPLDITPDA